MKNTDNSEGVELERYLRGLILLSSRDGITTKELATAMGYRSPHAVQTMIRVMERNGFCFEKRHYRYTLLKVPAQLRSFDSYYWISPEELEPLSELVAEMGFRTPQTSDLLRKVLTICDQTSLAKLITQSEPAHSWSLLRKACREHHQVLLRGYESISSDQVADRKVEPYDFTTNYREVVCFDVEKQGVRHFKLDRIRGGVEILPVRWMYAHLHEPYREDVFHMSGPRTIPVRLRLTRRGKALLEEEYPLASRHLSAHDDHWEFTAKVARLEGVGRFVMGLPGEVEILESDQLRDYVSRAYTAWLNRQVATSAPKNEDSSTQQK